MEKTKFKTLRHIETVRNYLNTILIELIKRQELHDQTKLQSPEVEIFDTYTPLLKDIEYGSQEYRQCMKQMSVAVEHHHVHNRHHPEYHTHGIDSMTLLDLLEMLCDWKAAGLRHNDGDIFKSIEVNKKRFEISGQLERILRNTAEWLNSQSVLHWANES